MIKILKRFGSVLIMLLLLVSTLAIQAMAATGSVNGLSIATSGSTGKVSTGTNSATLTVSKSWSLSGGTSEDTFIFTHPDTSTSDVQVSFDYSFSGTEKTISGVTEDTGTKCSVTLSPGGSFSVYVKATAGSVSSATSTFSITNLSVVEVVDSARVTVEFDADLGSVTVDGDAVETSAVLTVPNTGASFVAAPSGDAGFLAWVDGTGKIVSREKSYVCKPTEATLTLKAVFADTTPWFYVDNGDYLVEGWETAVTHTGTVALANDATLPAGNYTVPSGVILLIPYDSALTASVETPVVEIPTSKQDDPTAYRTLTLETGAHITVNGTMTVPAAVRAGDSTTTLAATMVKGTYGHVSMNSGSSITVKNGAKLSVYGYITGSGGVVAESGAKVYEAFQIMRFRGGTATASMATAKKAFPISQYYVQNIEVPLTLYSGASEIAYEALYMSDTVIDSQIEYIGQSGCLFNLTSGYMVKQYDKANDRQQIDFYGDLTVSKFSISIKYIITYSINSENFVMPITNNMTVDIHDGATVTIGANMSMLPGAEIDIHKGGTLKLSSGKALYLYDLEEWSGKNYLYGSSDMAALAFAPNRTKTRTAADLKDAQIVVEGTLDAAAGKLYTSTNGAAIRGEEGGQVLLTYASATTDKQATQSSEIEYHDIAMNSAYLQHGNGEYMVTATDTYTYSNEVWNCTNHSYNDGEVTTAATCTTAGETTYTCTVCAEEKKETIEATGHTEAEAVKENNVDATCTAEGSYDSVVYCSVCEAELSRKTITASALGHSQTDAVQENVVNADCTTAGSYDSVVYCSRCKSVLSSESVTVSATGHTPGAEATCTAAQNCTVCGTELAAMLTHSYTVEQSKTLATCMAAGSVTWKCANCDATTTEMLSVDSTNHTGNDDTENAKAADCENTGYTGDTVCECGATIATGSVVEALGHTEEAIPAVEATCTTDGATAGAKCSVCGEVLTPAEPIPATGHGSTTTTTVDATCTTDGFVTVTCNGCGETVSTETIEATGHNYTSAVTKEPSCAEKGIKTYTCLCGDSYTEEIAANGHTEGSVVVENNTEASCVTAGSYDNVVYCAVCGSELSRETITVDAPGHNYESAVTAPTCTVGGYTTYTCATCDDSYIDSNTDAAGHSMGEWVVDTAATCTTDGSRHSQCANCDHAATEVIPATGHSYSSSVKEPTHTVAGYTTYTCGNCGDSYVDGETAALGHSYTSEVTTEPGCETAGVQTCTCTCGDTYTEAIAALGHDMVAADGKAATCTEAGYTAYTDCSRCDHIEGKEVLAATGHVNTTTTTVDATCTEDGSKTVTCDNCGTTVSTETLAAAGHNYSAAVTDPTCTEAGYTTYTCSVCGDTYTADDVVAAGHSYTSQETTAPTCTAAGVKTFTCANCGDSYTEAVEALGHTLTQVEAKTATCTEAGYEAYEYCSVCDYTTYAEVAATGHSYGEPTWAWVGNDTDGYTTATATFVCHCNDRQTETVSDIEVATTEATYEAAGSRVYTASVVFGDKTYTDTKTVEIPKLEVILDPMVNMTGTITPATVIAPSEGWKLGENTFTVSCSAACMVAYTEDDGETYYRLPATKATEGEDVYYSFTVTLTEETQIVIYIKGDIDGDGEIEGPEVMQIKATQLEKLKTFTDLQIMISDIDGDGIIEGPEVMQIKAAQLGKLTLAW